MSSPLTALLLPSFLTADLAPQTSARLGKTIWEIPESRPNPSYAEQARRADSDGKISEVCHLFQMHLHLATGDAQEWKNYGLCQAAVACREAVAELRGISSLLKLFTACREYVTLHLESYERTPESRFRDASFCNPLSSERGKKLLRRLQESEASLELAFWMGEPTAMALRSMVLGEIVPALICSHNSDSKYYERLFNLGNAETRLAFELVRTGEAMAGVKQLCSSAARVRVSISDVEWKKGYTRASTLRCMFVILRVCGVVAIDGVIAPETIGKVKEALWIEADKAGYKRIVQRIAGQKCGGGHRDQHGNEEYHGLCFESERLASRDHYHSRFELKLPMAQPFIGEDVVSPPHVMHLLKMAFRSRTFEIDSMTSIISLRNSHRGEWHMDVSDVFAGQIPDVHLPPASLVVLVPLVNLTEENGATAFMPGTHMRSVLPYESSRTADDAWLQEVGLRALHVNLPVGSVLIFDVRVRHRGEPNFSPEVRPILYNSYVQPWFQDNVNFQKSQTPTWSGLQTDSLKRLTRRIDEQQYIKNLEARLRELGGNVESLASNYSYKTSDLVV